MSILCPRVEAGGSGGRRLVFFLCGRIRFAPGMLTLLILGHFCIAVAAAALLGAWLMPIGEPYLGLSSLMLAWATALPTAAWIIAALLALPMCIALILGRIWSTPRPRDWEWSMNAPARIALASTAVLPVGAAALSCVALIGLSANPGLFPGRVAAVPAWCAWLFPVAMLASILLPALWLVTYRREMRGFRRACDETGPVCAECGYSLVGLPGDVCPECGVAGSQSRTEASTA